MSTLSSLILEDAKALQPTLQEYRRWLHQRPELGFDLTETKPFVISKLKEYGYDNIREVGKAGVTVTAGGKKPGKVYQIRADMDALPINEETDVEYKSCTPNKMHACGHDMHTTMLLGAAKILKDHEDEIDGTIKLMFQPAEETCEGCKDMIDAGILEDPKVDVAMMIHVAAAVPAPTGTIILPAGKTGLSSNDQFTITIQGKGAHGAMPQDGIDPINAGVHIFQALQALNAREIDPNDPFILTIGSFNSGIAPNVIPDSATLSGTIRTISSKVREKVKKRFEEIVVSQAEVFGAKATISYLSNCPVFLNDPGLVASGRRALTELFGQGNFIDYEAIGMTQFRVAGSEDFGYASEHVPTILVPFAVGDVKDGFKYGAHHPKAEFDDNYLYKGAATYAMCALTWLSENK